MRFRRDISGLRVAAVLSVVLYHFHMAPMLGGFVGVDIVIFGYLMHARVIDPLKSMCDDSACPTTDEAGRSLFIDAVHLRTTAVRDRYVFLDPVILETSPS